LSLKKEETHKLIKRAEKLVLLERLFWSDGFELFLTLLIHAGFFTLIVVAEEVRGIHFLYIFLPFLTVIPFLRLSFKVFPARKSEYRAECTGNDSLFCKKFAEHKGQLAELRCYLSEKELYGMVLEDEDIFKYFEWKEKK
jgi:hypothetical protein